MRELRHGDLLIEAVVKGEEIESVSERKFIFQDSRVDSEVSYHSNEH